MSESAVADRVFPGGYSDRPYNEVLRPLREGERGWTTFGLFCTLIRAIIAIGGGTSVAVWGRPSLCL